MSEALNLDGEDVTFDSFDAPALSNPALLSAFDELYTKLDPDQLALVDQPPHILGAINANAGCLTGDVKVKLRRAGITKEVSLADAYRLFNGLDYPHRNWDKTIPTFVKSLNEQTGRLTSNLAHAIVYSGRKSVFRITLADGKTLTGTADHPLYTRKGWRPLSETVGHELAIDPDTKHRKTGNGVRGEMVHDIEPTIGQYYPYSRHCKINGGRQTVYRARMHRLVREATLNNLTVDQLIAATFEPNHLTFLDPKVYDVHHKDEDHHNNDPANLEHLPVVEHRRLHSKGPENFKYGIPGYVKVVSIEPLGEQDTYDIQCAAPHHSFVANKIVVHNSGKSHSLITRAIRLALKEAISPSAQVLITFTNKAARELQVRWNEFFESHLSADERRLYGAPWISTIHRFGHHLLTLLTGTVHTVLTDSRSTKLLRALKAVDGQTVDFAALNTALDALYSANELHLFIWPELRRDGTLVKVHDIATDAPPPAYTALQDGYDRWTSSAIWTKVLHNVATLTEQKRQDLRAHYATLAGMPIDTFTAILLEYTTIKFQSHTLDYADMIYVPYTYLMQFPEARATVWARYTHFMMDEVQDCAPIDHALMSVVLGPDPKYILVGDTKQTLYSWRGAAPHVLDYLDRLFTKEPYLGKLTRNYRSTAQLVTLANSFASRFERRRLHESVPVKPAVRNALSILTFDTHLEENTWIVRDIRDTKAANPKTYAYNDFVVLARANRSLTQLEASFIQQGVPYQIKTDPRQISKSPAYSFVHALYTLLINPRDVTALVGLAEHLYGIGPKARSKLLAALQEFIAANDTAPLWDAPILTQRPFTALETLHAAILAPVASQLRTHPLSVINNTLVGALTTQAHWADVPPQSPDEVKPLRFTVNWTAIDRIFQLADLVYTLSQSDTATAIVTEGASPTVDHYESFLEVYAMLTTSKDATELDDNADRVILSTVHAFKGRQAKRIYYVHLNRTTLIPPSQEDEERCAFYVAITRAQEKLTLTASASAPNFKMQPMPTYPNTFLLEYIAAVKNLARKTA